MDKKELDKLTNSIKEKIGEEANNLIVDDIASLYTLNQSSLDNEKTLNDQVADLKKRNETLVNANSRLLQQIPAIKEEDDVNDEVKSKSNFNFMDAFDDRGHFKKKL